MPNITLNKNEELLHEIKTSTSALKQSLLFEILYFIFAGLIFIVLGICFYLELIPNGSNNQDNLIIGYLFFALGGFMLVISIIDAIYSIKVRTKIKYYITNQRLIIAKPNSNKSIMIQEVSDCYVKKPTFLAKQFPNVQNIVMKIGGSSSNFSLAGKSYTIQFVEDIEESMHILGKVKTDLDKIDIR